MVLDRLRLKNEALANQWLPRSELYDLQFRKLRALLSYSYENVPFYRSRFKRAGLEPDSIRLITDLKTIPILSKEDIRKSPQAELISEKVEVDSCRRVYTSGTTGAPASILLDKGAMAWRLACSARVSDAIGYDPWDHGAVLNFTGSRRDERGLSLKQRFASWALRRRNRYSRAFYFTYDCSEILDELVRFKPRIVEGQPAYLRKLASALRRSGSSMDIKMTISSGDILDPWTRKEVESFFQCPLYDVYGGRDAGPLAWQCKVREGYHMNIDTHVFEFINEEGENCSPGEQGRLVVTCLDNYAMPLIRYDVGDVVTFDDHECPCGRSLPMIRNIEGRYLDFFTLPNGRRISPRSIVSSIRGIPGLPSYQLVGVKRDEVILRFFSETIQSDVVDLAVEKCKQLLGNEVEVKATLAKEEPKAKLRSVIPYRESGEALSETEESSTPSIET